MKTYEVIDGKTKKVVGQYINMRRASRRVNELDNIYGSYRYYYRRIAA